MGSARLGLFECDADIRIARIEGAVCERLGCGEAELLSHGWHPFLHRDDWSPVAAMGADLEMSKAGRYQIRAVAKGGDRLFLGIRTHLVFGRSAPWMRGVIELLSSENVRRFFDLSC